MADPESNGHDPIDCLCQLPSEATLAKMVKARAAYIRDPDLAKAAGSVGYPQSVLVPAKDAEAWGMAREAAYAGDKELAKDCLTGQIQIEKKILRLVLIAQEVVEKKLMGFLENFSDMKGVDIKYLVATLDHIGDLRKKYELGSPVNSKHVIPNLSLPSEGGGDPDSLDTM